MFYFLYCAPLWRRNCIFVYRPKFDSGGMRWPFLVDVLISSMVLGQVLLCTMMALKKAFGPAFLAAIPIVPVMIFRSMSKHRYLKAYMDAGLLQTSLLDGWDNSLPTSMEKREEYRQFLIDAHKAAYIPICIAGGATSVLTAEPAVVVPHENDDDAVAAAPYAHHEAMDVAEAERVPLLPSTPLTARASAQFGASLRRVPSTVRSSHTEDSRKFTFVDQRQQGREHMQHSSNPVM
uniref:CSC1/OSCA1-like 7TM region domain-containing protein n=1 Tax=Pseudictyota dubia TaxID=2749911 RepID=A0A7R9WJW5_9STRA|mmetsp:Transcript_6567/g.11509  ORF Transcript_6567/g.11509 Transcript_6567/m.11509 type:complete len:235 (+) Transcript_6567:1-705(+)